MVDFLGAAAIFKRIKAAVSPSAEAAANRMATQFQKTVRKELSTFPHGAHTRTPSPPGGFPGLISSDLRDSVLTSPAIPLGAAIWEARVGPHTIYAAIQEFGGDMNAHGDYMSWVTDGKRYYKKHVELPARPYMRPAAAILSDTGVLTDVAMEAIASILYPAEGI